MRKSHYQPNDPVVLTNDCYGYLEGQVFAVVDPMKYGKKHKIFVRDINTGRVVSIPSKYLDDIN